MARQVARPDQKMFQKRFLCYLDLIMDLNYDTPPPNISKEF